MPPDRLTNTLHKTCNSRRCQRASRSRRRRRSCLTRTASAAEDTVPSQVNRPRRTTATSSSPSAPPPNAALAEPPVIAPGHTFGTITDKISAIVLTRRTPVGWMVGFGIAFLAVMMFLTAVTYLFLRGVGIWGVNVPIAWGFAIVNFVWWIGIGHAGTLISAILLLLHQKWRQSINRFAEAMTLFAVACAGMFPLLHTGRPWVAYWLMPYPNTMGLWPQFRSPLVWDVFAVSTYLTVSALFWYVGLIPDFATLRDKTPKKWVAKIWGILAMGWRGAARHWDRYEKAYLILAGLSTPLVLSVHSIVSLDFAVSIVPGWNPTLFPPYFVAGAIFAGFAMVIILAIPTRKWYGLEHLITMKHFDWMSKIMLATGLIVAYGYVSEVFYAYYSGSVWEIFLIRNRMTGPYWPLFWSLWLCSPAKHWAHKLWNCSLEGSKRPLLGR